MPRSPVPGSAVGTENSYHYVAALSRDISRETRTPLKTSYTGRPFVCPPRGCVVRLLSAGSSPFFFSETQRRTLRNAIIRSL